jgi:outer membrane protein W
MKLIFSVLAFSVTLFSLHVAAQTVSNRDLASFSWEAAFPADNKYLNESSFSGWRFEYRKGIKKDFTLGVALSWNAFSEYVPTTTYQTPSGTKAITTDMIRHVYTLPITLIGHYYFSTKGKILEPYAGLGVGAQYAEQLAYLNVYELSETNWGFVARPELGTLFNFGHDSPVKAMLGVGFNISTNKNEAFNINGWNHLTVNVGIGIGNVY